MDLKKISKIFIIISMILGCFLIVPIIIGAIALSKLKEEKLEKKYAVISILTIFLCSVAGGLLMLIYYIEKNNNDVKLIKDIAKILIIISMVIGSSSILPIIIGAIALSKIDSQTSRKELIIITVLTTASCSISGGILMFLTIINDSNVSLEDNENIKNESEIKNNEQENKKEQNIEVLLEADSKKEINVSEEEIKAIETAEPIENKEEQNIGVLLEADSKKEINVSEEEIKAIETAEPIENKEEQNIGVLLEADSKKEINVSEEEIELEELVSLEKKDTDNDYEDEEENDITKEQRRHPFLRVLFSLFITFLTCSILLGGSIGCFFLYMSLSSENKLESIKPNITYYLNEDGTYSVGIVKNSKTNIVIPEKYKNNIVTSISINAFQNCTNLEKVKLPSTIKSIEYGAFKNCTSLKEIEIPNGVEYIGQCAFENCSSLETVKLPSTLTSIGDYAFYYCKNLTKIVIPLNVESMGCNLFINCDNLKIYCVAKSEPSSWNAFWNAYGCPVYYGYLEED